MESYFYLSNRLDKLLLHKKIGLKIAEFGFLLSGAKLKNCKIYKGLYVKYFQNASF